MLRIVYLNEIEFNSYVLVIVDLIYSVLRKIIVQRFTDDNTNSNIN